MRDRPFSVSDASQKRCQAAWTPCAIARQGGPQGEGDEWEAGEERNPATMNAIVLHAKSDADGVLHT